MNFREFFLLSEIAGLLGSGDPAAVLETFAQPQVGPKDYGQQVRHLQQWWSNWTDPRGKLEKAKRLVQAVLNKTGREGVRGRNGEDLVPLMTEIRDRLMRLYAAMPDPMDKTRRIPTA